MRMNAATRRILGLDAAPPDYFQRPVEERNALFSRRDAQGHPLAPEDTPMLRALRGEVLTGPNAVNGRMRTLDGRDVETTTSAVPLRDHEGQIVGAVGILRDQTEHNQLAREREEAPANELAVREVNERLDTFFAIAAHDLRTPVAASQMAVQLAQRQVQRAAARAWIWPATNRLYHSPRSPRRCKRPGGTRPSVAAHPPVNGPVTGERRHARARTQAVSARCPGVRLRRGAALARAHADYYPSMCVVLTCDGHGRCRPPEGGHRRLPDECCPIIL